jgi:ATP-dependent RNA helicase SUPV3L1/SUV3
MAEWLGCTIPDLYAVLEALGHKKIEETVQETAAEETSVPDAVVPEAVTAAPPAAAPAEAEATVPADPVPETPAAAPSLPAEKPVLATFALRRGKAYGSQAKRPERKPWQGKPENKGKKPFEKDKAKAGQPGEKSFRKPPRKSRDEKPRRDEPRVISAAAPQSGSSSPFDVLRNLKTGK